MGGATVEATSDAPPSPAGRGGAEASQRQSGLAACHRCRPVAVVAEVHCASNPRPGSGMDGVGVGAIPPATLGGPKADGSGSGAVIGNPSASRALVFRGRELVA